MESARGAMKVLYVVSLFPCWSETFIVREVVEMLRLGDEVRIVSLRHPSESMVQSDAAALLDRVVYPPGFARSALSVAVTLLRHPLREARELSRLVGALARHPEILAKSLVVWWRTLALTPAVRDIAPAHIHAHFATYPSTAALLLSERLAIPFSFTAHAHDIFLEDHLLGAKMRAAAFTAAISRFNEDWMRARAPDARAAPVRIVHCGVSPDAFEFRERGAGAARILAVGRLEPIKGFIHLVEACGLLRARGVAFQCDIIGSGMLEGELAHRIEALGLAGTVRLLGARKQEEVRACMAEAAVMVMPSVVTPRGDRDGIPVALMEAMAVGIPVVSTRVSGIPELVEDGVTGLLAAPGDAGELADCIARLLADAGLAARLARAARSRIEQEFNVHREARKLHDAIAAPP